MQRVENNQNQTQRSYQGVNKPLGSNANSLKSRLSDLQNKVNNLRQSNSDSFSSGNTIHYAGSFKRANTKNEQNVSSFEQVISGMKSMRENTSSNMNEVFTSVNSGKKPIVNFNKTSFAVVNSICGNSVEVLTKDQEKPVVLSLRQLYNAMNPKD